MSERTFTQLLDLNVTARALTHAIDALMVLPKFDANQDIIKSYEDQLDKLIAEMRELVK